MLKILFSEENGGPLEVDGDRGLMELTQRQQNLWKGWWTSTFDKNSSLATRQASSKNFKFIADPWASLVTYAHEVIPEGVLDEYGSIRDFTPRPEPVMFASPLGLSLRQVGERFGFESMKIAHLRYSRPDDVNLSNISQSPREMRALVEFYIRLSAASTEPINSSSNVELLEHVKKIAGEWSTLKEIWAAEWEGIKQNSSEESGRVTDLVGQASSKLMAWEGMTIGAVAKLEEDRVKFNTGALSAIEDFRTEFAQMKASYETELKINSAVALWTTRTADFEKAAKKGMKWARWVAGGGVAGAILWVMGSYSFAGWLFEQAVERPSFLENVRVRLNPVFHFQLIFTSVSAVFYITMFLWVMRLMIKNYLANEHLRIDAMSRSSMAETYIALIKDGGATADGDRAIVLASLFRPVTDGLVKDDGPPAISLPAILAGVAQGRN